MFVASSLPANLSAALAGKYSATVDATYGDACVEGSVLTMAHHGPRAGQRAPCMYPNGCAEGVEIVGLSRIDLNTLGGCMAVLGNKPKVLGFWELVARVNPNDLRELSGSGASSENQWRVWSCMQYLNGSMNEDIPPTDGSVADVTERVVSMVFGLDIIITGTFWGSDDFRKMLEKRRLEGKSYFPSSSG